MVVGGYKNPKLHGYREAARGSQHVPYLLPSVLNRERGWEAKGDVGHGAAVPGAAKMITANPTRTRIVITRGIRSLRK